MTIYRPRLKPNGKPAYLALADAIARDIESGVLRPGMRLPTQRELARALGVSIGTVTRGYAEAERRGLIRGEVGRGTYVRAPAAAAGWGVASGDPGMVDLSLALPWTLPGDEEVRLLADALGATSAGADIAELLQFRPEAATLRHRRLAAWWLAREGVPARPETVVITAGAQHALMVAFSTLLPPGAAVAVEQLTYPGVQALARMLGVELRGVALDAEGMVPDALDWVCREGRVRAVYCVADAQNPTGATMSETRRQEIVAVARAHDVVVIEDDVHRMLVEPGGKPLAAIAPERTVYVATFSKALAFGLRTALVAVPERMVERMTAGIRTTIWMAPPLMAEVTLRWLSDGTADALARRKRDEMVARQRMVAEVLGGRCIARSAAGSIHAWLELPDPWGSGEFVAHARGRGVLVAGAEAFLVGRGPVPPAVRIAVGSPPRREELRRALDVLAELLAGPPASLSAIV